VEFVDGSSIAQASPPDMRLPIALALGWPRRVPGAAPALDLTRTARWDFHPLDDDAFPAVRLARAAGAAGGTYPAVYNAANEVGVEAFHAGRIAFLDIVDTVEQVMAEHRPEPAGVDALDLAGVLAADAWARDAARRSLTPGTAGRTTHGTTGTAGSPVPGKGTA